MVCHEKSLKYFIFKLKKTLKDDHKFISGRGDDVNDNDEVKL